MDLFSHLLLGFQTAFLAQNLLYCFIGTLLGTLIGVLPGIGPTATIALLLPVTYSLEPTASLIMLAGIYYGAQYGGSTTAILINLPGEASTAVTTIDGYQMARQGRAGPALAIAAIGSFIAGTFATLVIAVFAVPLTRVALEFRSVEYFSLIVFGLVASVALAHGSILKALTMVVLGLLLGLVGIDITSGVRRFTLGLIDLDDGINIVALAVGVFGIAEIMRNLEDEMSRSATATKVSSLLPAMSDLRASAGAILRGSGIGAFLGVLPGSGAMLSSFAAYAVEKRLAKDPSRFGRGAIEGVAAPESANNAGAQTSFIPLMAGAMIMQGIPPGPNVINDRPDLFWGLIASMWIGNLMLVILNLPLIGIWVRLLTVSYNILFPTIIAFCLIGTFSINNNPFDLYTVAVFGLVGYILMKLECEPAPLLLGFVLGPMLEENFRRAMTLSRGDPTIFLTRPISLGLLIMAALLLFVVARPSIASKREVLREEE
jgi:TctA family transporter